MNRVFRAAVSVHSYVRSFLIDLSSLFTYNYGWFFVRDAMLELSDESTCEEKIRSTSVRKILPR